MRAAVDWAKEEGQEAWVLGEEGQEGWVWEDQEGWVWRRATGSRIPLLSGLPSQQCAGPNGTVEQLLTEPLLQRLAVPQGSDVSKDWESATQGTGSCRPGRCPVSCPDLASAVPWLYQ